MPDNTPTTNDAAKTNTSGAAPHAPRCTDNEWHRWEAHGPNQSRCTVCGVVAPGAPVRQEED